MTKAVIYARYSSSNQTEQSIEGQVRVCTEYAKSNDLELVGTYVDRAISGRTDNRPDFLRMIADSSKNIFDAIIVYKTDRFARNKYDSAIYKNKLRKNGIQIHYAAESIPGGPEGIILESLMEGLAEYYSAELSQKIQRGKHESALKGRVLGSIPLGYVSGPDKTYHIDPDKAKVVRTIFELYNEGIATIEICKTLNARGERTAAGRPFTKSSLSSIIKNVKYIGIYKYRDMVNEDSIPAIISKEVFITAQKELNKRTNSKQARVPRAEYLLADKLYCGHCKKKMTGVSGTGRNKRKFYYYYCPASRAKTGCDKKHVSRDWIEDLVVSTTIDYLLQPGVIDALAQKIHAMQETNTEPDDLQYFQKRLAENKRASANILTAIESGVITETLPARLKELEDERCTIEDEINYCEQNQFTLTESEIAFMLNNFLEPTEDLNAYRQRIITSFVSEVYLYNDKLTLYYNISNGSGLTSANTSLVESNRFDQRCIDRIFFFVSKYAGYAIFVFVSIANSLEFLSPRLS